MKTVNLKYLTVSALVLAIVLMFSVSLVSANPSFFIRQNNGITTTATTSVTYQSVGAATTTIYFDAQANGNPNGADSATLLWQFTASSTNSTTDLYLEYAQSGNDCIATPTSCDWYYSGLASTSPANINVSNISTIPFVRWQYAATAQGLAGGAVSGSRALRIIDVPTPTRYVRAHFVIPNLTHAGTASSSAVWAEFVAKKQSR